MPARTAMAPIQTRPLRRPQPRAGLEAPYAPARAKAPTDLWLAGNEGRPPAALEVDLSGVDLARYPDAAHVERALAERVGVSASRVLATAGADDALLRIALAYLGPGRTLVLPTPTFEMIPRYARIAGAELREVPWRPGAPYPTDAVLAAARETDASVVCVVSPNNPTGAVASEDDVRRLAEALPGALVVVDCAYAEFADEDLTRVALERPNCVALRTMSKAYGCAGLRVGFALGAEDVLGALRAAGNPYPCAAPSLGAAEARLGARDEVSRFVARVREEREALRALLGDLGIDAAPSQGNFVYAEVEPGRARRLQGLIAGAGVAVRAFTSPAGALRITCPGDPDDFARLERALRAAIRPDALLFDMDGVLADVSRSYRAAIEGTASAFGVQLAPGAIDAAKAAGDANDDWALTWRLVRDAGVDVTLEEVTERFEALYQGADGAPGLCAREGLMVSREALSRLADAARLGVVTGRPRADAEAFLSRFGLTDLFETVVTREDAPLKPSGEPTALAMERLGARTAWLVGDTPDDVVSARAAGAIAVGTLPPGAGPGLADALTRAGAGVVLGRAADVEDLLR